MYYDFGSVYLRYGWLYLVVLSCSLPHYVYAVACLMKRVAAARKFCSILTGAPRGSCLCVCVQATWELFSAHLKLLLLAAPAWRCPPASQTKTTSRTKTTTSEKLRHKGGGGREQRELLSACKRDCSQALRPATII